ncbi:MAG: hypothetical protein RIT27_1564 [Pseudomonadota bacterium]|jgi:peptidoglycan/LPS O-acetylase OafA/YrhL
MEKLSFDLIKMNNLDVLRAIAILAVFAHHLAHVYHFQVPFFHQHGGWFGVQLFFLLSGYLIIQSADKYSPRNYFIHRILRIFPAYLIFYIMLGWFGGVLSFQKILEQPIDFVLNLVLLQHFSPIATTSFNVLNVTWTLTIEICWYVCAILLVKPIKRFPTTALLSSIGISTLWTYLATHHQLDWIFQSPNDEQRYLFLNNAFPAQVVFFVMGAYIYFKQDWLMKQNPFLLALMGVIILSSWFEAVHLLTNPNFISGIGLSAIVIMALQAPTLYVPFLKWIADISYSIYLLHFSLLLYTYHHLNWKNPSSIFGAIALILLITTLSYYAIEKPAMRLARRLT